jgi:ribokinase
MILRKPIVVVGSINMDLVATAGRIPVVGETVAGNDFQTHHGGKGANQAVAVARLGYPVELIGRLGTDRFGDELCEGLTREGVDVTGVKRVDGSSGIAVIVVSSRGENSIVVIPGANATLSATDLEGYVEQIRGASMVLAQLEVPMETVLRLAEMCAREGVPLMLDPAPAQTLPDQMLPLITWFTPNETEAEFFANCLRPQDNEADHTAAVSQALLQTGVRNLLLKRGERGFYVAAAGGESKSHPAYTVSAVDTTAAGDAFNGAFAVALANGTSPFESASFAAAAAAISVTRIGAQSSMPTLKEVEGYLQAAVVGPRDTATTLTHTMRESMINTVAPKEYTPHEP